MLNNFKLLYKCTHGVLGGKLLKRCKKCISHEMNITEKLFNEKLDIENKKKKDQELNRIKQENIENQITSDIDKIIQDIDDRRKDNIRKVYLSNKNLIKKNLKLVENSNLDYLCKMNPYEFEKEVAKMFEMNGFTAELTPKSNDGGKDIILKKNNFIYLVECKRYRPENKIGREYLQKFFAAICESKAVGGYFITTSDYTSTAYEYPNAIDNKIILINGESLSKAIMFTFPHSVKFFDNYDEVCLECGQLVSFNYPKIKIKKCKNGHDVYSSIDKLKKSIKEYK